MMNKLLHASTHFHEKMKIRGVAHYRDHLEDLTLGYFLLVLCKNV